MTSTGSCFCKKITYSFTGEPVKKGLCHCPQCQKFSSSAFTYNALIPRPNFKWTSELPKSNSFVQESGKKIVYRFCPECGTMLTKESDELFNEYYILLAGTIDGDMMKEKPEVEFWVSQKPEWNEAVVGVEQKEQF